MSDDWPDEYGNVVCQNCGSVNELNPAICEVEIVAYEENIRFPTE